MPFPWNKPVTDNFGTFGMRNTGNWTIHDSDVGGRIGGLNPRIAGIRPTSFVAQMAMLYLADLPITGMTALFDQNKETDDPEFSWWQQRIIPAYGSIFGAFMNHACTIAYVNGGVQGQTVYIRLPSETALLFTIESVVIFTMRPEPASLNPDIQQGDSRYALQAIVTNIFPNGDNSVLEVCLTEDDISAPADVIGSVNLPEHTLAHANSISGAGTASPEGSGPPNSRLYSPEKIENNVQLILTAGGLTGTAHATRTVMGPNGNIANDIKLREYEHGCKIESALLLGRRSEEWHSRSGQPRRVTDGLISIIIKNGGFVSDFRYETDPTVVGRTWMNGWYRWLTLAMNQIGQYKLPGKRQKIMLVGDAALMELSMAIIEAQNSRYLLKAEEHEFGFTYTKFIVPSGETLLLMKHPLLSKNPAYTNSAIIYEAEGLATVSMKGRECVFMKAAEAKEMVPGWRDTTSYGWLSELGLWVENPSGCAVLWGFGQDNLQ